MQAKELETELDQAFVDVEYQISVDSCKDHDVCRQTCLLAYCLAHLSMAMCHSQCFRCSCWLLHGVRYALVAFNRLETIANAGRHMADLSRRLLIVLIVSGLLEVYTSPVVCLLLQKRCKMWADAGECDANPGFMTNNCKVACKKCTLPVSAPTKKAQAGLSTSPANLISKAAVTVQQGVSNASEAAGSLVSAGQEAAGNLVSTGKEAADSLVGTGKEAAVGLVSSGKEAAGNAVTTGKEAVGQLVSTGKDIATNLSSNVTAVKDKVTGGSTTGSSKGQNQAGESVLGKILHRMRQE